MSEEEAATEEEEEEKEAVSLTEVLHYFDRLGGS